MSDSPTTFRGEPAETASVEWNDSAELHRRDEGGVLAGFKAVRRGTLAELVRFVMTLPDEERGDYAIAKGGDRRFGPAEIEALSRRADFSTSGT